jgi:hypothetical protein
MDVPDDYARGRTTPIDSDEGTGIGGRHRKKMHHARMDS